MTTSCTSSLITRSTAPLSHRWPLGTACDPTPARMVAGALAHLAQYMATGCPRSAHLAALLLDKIASDAEADEHLRRHARQLMDILPIN